MATSKARHDNLVTAHVTLSNLKAETEQVRRPAPRAPCPPPPPLTTTALAYRAV
jgi:hypothetical protein